MLFTQYAFTSRPVVRSYWNRADEPADAPARGEAAVQAQSSRRAGSTFIPSTSCRPSDPLFAKSDTRPSAPRRTILRS